MDISEFSIVARFWPFSSILVLLVLRRSTEGVHAVPKTEPSEMGTVITRKRSDGSTGLLPGVTINTSATDFAPIKQFQLRKFKGDRWELFGDVISSKIDE
jgi:hypothetical protein